MIHTVVSVDGSAYLDWQTRLLEFSYRRVGQQGYFTRIWSSDREPTPFSGDTFVTPNYQYSHNDDYSPYNRILGVRDWCRAEGPRCDSVLIVDPDMIFLDRIDQSVTPGFVVGHRWSFFSEWAQSAPRHLDGRHPDWMVRHCDAPSRVSELGNPWIFHRDDLRSVHELLPGKTAEVRSDPNGWDPWVAEMWAVVIVLAELGLTPVYADFTANAHQNGPGLGRALLHYGWPQLYQSWSWSKTTYRPWDQGAPPPEGCPETYRVLHSLIREFIDTTRNREEDR